MILTVTVPDARTFEAYFYGYGEVISTSPVKLSNSQEWVQYVIAYDDRFHAQYQADRFLSGLYGAEMARQEAGQ